MSSESIKLTKIAKTRYHKIESDIKRNKNVQIAKNVDEFLSQLNA